MSSWKHIVSRVAPNWLPEPLQDRFWRVLGNLLGAIFVSFFYELHVVFFEGPDLPNPKFDLLLRRPPCSCSGSMQVLTNVCHEGWGKL